MTNSLNLTDLLIYQQSVLRNILFEYIKGIGICSYWEYIQEYILLEYDQKYTLLEYINYDYCYEPMLHEQTHKKT